MTHPCDLLITNVKIATMQDNGVPYGLIESGAVAVHNGKIVYVGESTKCRYKTNNIIDGSEYLLTPGLIDCHTHLVYGGDRAGEFEQRLQGVSYADIAKAGGGIKSTVKATREAGFDTLFNAAAKRATCLLKEGVTTVEIKSGYGLDLDTELKMLEVANGVGEYLGINVSTTYLGAHALPPEYQNNPDGYIDFVCSTVMPKVAEGQYATCVDVFCESIGFTPEQSQRVFEAAGKLGLKVKAHVEQLSDLKGAVLASQYNALSVDHVEFMNPSDVPSLTKSGTVAVLLPGAFYYLNETQKPPIDAFRKHKVPMAVATDLNPGSSPMASLLTAMNMASVFFGLTPEEALAGATVNGAKALGLVTKGVIAKGMDADMCLWDVSHPCELAYAINQHRPEQIWIGGKHVVV